MLLLHADPLLLEMKVEQLELRLPEVEKTQAALLARLEQYESREETPRNLQPPVPPPWSLDYEPLTDTTGLYSPGQRSWDLLDQSPYQACIPGQQSWGPLSHSPHQASWGPLSQSPHQASWDPLSQSPKPACNPGEQTRSFSQSRNQTSVKVLPSSEINKAILSSCESVAHAHHHLCVPSKVTTLAVKLARKAVFGDNVMRRCTPYGARDFPELPITELAELKQTIRNLFPMYWNKPQEFEVLWTKCVDAIGQACKRLRH